ncbi:MAG: GFA family protein [Pseudomonadota bacterium]
MKKLELSGSCLCGSVAYTVTGDAKAFYHCHCQRCRKVTGTGHASNLLLTEGEVDWTRGAEHLRRYDVPGAIRFASVFCKRCGSYLPRVSPGLVAVPAGTLDHEPDMLPEAHIFAGSRAAWSCSDTALPEYAEYPD